MEEKEVAIGNPVAVAGVTIIPVATVLRNQWHGKRGVSSWGSIQPVSIIVLTPTARRAFSITGEELSLEQLIQEVPEVKEVLDT